MTEIKRQRHQCPRLLKIRPDAPKLIWMEPRGSTHSTKGHWHPDCILQKKPQVLNPTQQEALHLFETSRGKQSSMSPHWDEASLPLLNLHRNPEIHVRTEEEPWGSEFNSRWGPMPLHWLERNPKSPLTTRMETWHSWGNTSRSLSSPSQLKRKSKCPAATEETQ